MITQVLTNKDVVVELETFIKEVGLSLEAAEELLPTNMWGSISALHAAKWAVEHVDE